MNFLLLIEDSEESKIKSGFIHNKKLIKFIINKKKEKNKLLKTIFEFILILLLARIYLFMHQKNLVENPGVNRKV